MKDITSLTPEHGHNLELGVLEKTKLTHHAYEKGHRIGWDVARILETESINGCRNWKD
jgi:hypothetical protein